MASYRRKYASLEQADASATTEPSDKPTPITAEPVEPKPAEAAPEPEKNPVKEAEQSAIKQRLAEAERAAEMQRAPAEPPPPIADDLDEQERVDQFIAQLEQVIAPLPNEESKNFFRQHPEFLYDPEQQARANHFHYVTMREVGEPYTPQWLARMKSHLGIDQPPPQPQPQPQRQAVSPPNGSAGPMYSAPPTREVPSMSSGRPVSYSNKVHLTPEERDMAHRSNISEEEYARQKLRIMRMKQDGYHQDGQ